MNCLREIRRPFDSSRSPPAQFEWQRDSGERFGFGPCARTQDVGGIDEAEAAFLQAEGNGRHIRQMRKQLTLVLKISANHRHRFQCDSPTSEGMYLHPRAAPARLLALLLVLFFNRGRVVFRSEERRVGHWCTCT